MKRPLTVTDLKKGGWVCHDVSEGAAKAFEELGLKVFLKASWGSQNPVFSCCVLAGNYDIVSKASKWSLKEGLFEIELVDNKFYLSTY